jgi:hypothetical protein
VNHEIVKVTARATDTFTIVRAQEGTSGRAFNAGDPIELRLTAGFMNAPVFPGYISIPGGNAGAYQFNGVNILEVQVNYSYLRSENGSSGAGVQISDLSGATNYRNDTHTFLTKGGIQSLSFTSSAAAWAASTMTLNGKTVLTGDKTTYTPTISASGTLTSSTINSCWYKKIGTDMVKVHVDFVATATGVVSFSVPFQTTDPFAIFLGRECNVTGHVIQAPLSSGQSTAGINDYTNAAPAGTNYRYVLECVYAI